MRSHQFADNTDIARIPVDMVVLRMRAYLRNRFGKPPLPKKGRALRLRNIRRLTCKSWKR